MSFQLASPRSPCGSPATKDCICKPSILHLHRTSGREEPHCSMTVLPGKDEFIAVNSPTSAKVRAAQGKGTWKIPARTLGTQPPNSTQQVALEQPRVLPTRCIQQKSHVASVHRQLSSVTLDQTEELSHGPPLRVPCPSLCLCWDAEASWAMLNLLGLCSLLVSSDYQYSGQRPRSIIQFNIFCPCNKGNPFHMQNVGVQPFVT